MMRIILLMFLATSSFAQVVVSVGVTDRGGAGLADDSEDDRSPTDFPNGIAIPALTNATKYYSVHPIEGSTDVIAVEAHASPYDPDAHKARIEAEVSRRQAIKAELDLTQQQIDAIRTYFTSDVDAIFPTLTAQQRQFLKVQRAAVRYLLKQEVKEVSAP